MQVILNLDAFGSILCTIRPGGTTPATSGAIIP